MQINGKLRGRVVVAAGADGPSIEQTARDDPKIAVLLEGKTIKQGRGRAGQAGQFRGGINEPVALSRRH